MEPTQPPPEPHRSAYHNFGRWLTRSRPGVYFYRYVFTPIDRGVARMSGGRRRLSPQEIPQMLLTTTGRKSGEPRSTPVLYLREDDAYVIIGSNYGRSHHPAWTYNLAEHPSATVTIDGRATEVTARRATAEEFERFWPLSLIHI